MDNLSYIFIRLLDFFIIIIGPDLYFFSFSLIMLLD